LAGNQPITDFLEKSLAAGKIANAYIFLGPKDLGKTAAAVFFAKSLLCQSGQKDGFFLWLAALVRLAGRCGIIMRARTVLKLCTATFI
jgi:hypothetical protein